MIQKRKILIELVIKQQKSIALAAKKLRVKYGIARLIVFNHKNSPPKTEQ
jgi:hypothetical protein